MSGARVASPGVDYNDADDRLEVVQKASRRHILVFYWIVAILAVPFWWGMTSIQRLSIPEGRVQEQSGRRLVLTVDVVFQVDNPKYNALEAGIRSELSTRVRSQPERWDGLAVRFPDASASNGASAYTVRLGSCDIACGAASHHLSVNGRQLFYQTAEGGSATEVVDGLESLLLPPVSSVQAQYAPRYRLAFSLLNEDSSMGGAAIDWDIDHAIRRYLSPLLEELSVLHNFTVESQVQYHAPLAFTPHSVVEGDKTVLELDQDQLKTFVNSAEWSLASSVNNDIVLHFLLFVPSMEHRPLHVTRPEGGWSNSNAFLTPQWGGIAIWNPPLDPDAPSVNRHLDVTTLAPIFSLFRSQLRSLLGVPPLPKAVSLSTPKQNGSRGGLSPWQLDALLRRRTLENVKGATETLESIVRLVHQIQSMPVKADVVGDVVSALNALDTADEVASSSGAEVSTGSPLSPLEQTLVYSSQAATFASRAFFNPDMLAMLYFPAEHTFAVYTPLFLPVAVPLLAMTLKELGQILKARRAARTGGVAATETSSSRSVLGAVRGLLSGSGRKQKIE